MPNPYSPELRERAVKAYENKEGTYAEVAERFTISVPTLERWVARSRSTGKVEALPKGGGNFSHVNVGILLEVVKEHPDWTTEELTAEYNRRAPRGARAHRSSIFRALRREGFVCKKNDQGRQSKTGRKSARSGATSATGGRS